MRRMFISFPLCLFGTVIGRNWNGLPDNPCRVKRIPSPIPRKKWYLQPAVIAIMGGLLPFGSIFIEMYFIFTSFWNYKVHAGLCLCCRMCGPCCGLLLSVFSESFWDSGHVVFQDAPAANDEQTASDSEKWSVC
jgi:Endomembrane protein 70